jgi:hypothetical protein
MTWTVRYWILEKTRSCIIPKDPEWLNDHIEEFKSVWNEVLEHRKNGTLPQPKDKGILVL